jgi:hypothetical protein
MRPVPAPRHTSELPWPLLRPVVQDAGEPGRFPDRQVDSVEIATVNGQGFATDTVARCSVLLKCYLLAGVLVRGFSDAARNAVPLRPLVAHALASSRSSTTS